MDTLELCGDILQPGVSSISKIFSMDTLELCGYILQPGGQLATPGHVAQYIG